MEVIKEKPKNIYVDVASKLNRSILGFNIQIIKRNRILAVNLAMSLLTERHTSEYLCSIISEYNIYIKNISTLTIDNRSNQIKVGKMIVDDQITINDDKLVEDGKREEMNSIK